MPKTGPRRRSEPVPTITTRQGAILDGLMLGDGSLFRYKPTHNPYLSVVRAERDVGYQQWLVDQCPGWFPRGIVSSQIRDTRTGKTYYSTRVKTDASPLLVEPYNRWYPQGKKVVPADLELTPLAIAVWLCDDGNVRQSPARRVRKGTLVSKLATNGFELGEVRQLAHLLEDRYERSFSVSSAGPGQWAIYGGDRATRAMIDEIDEHIPAEMERKAFWRTPEGQHSAPSQLGWKAQNTHCAQGHRWTAETTQRAKRGYRVCTICLQVYTQRARAAEKLRATEWALRTGWPTLADGTPARGYRAAFARARKAAKQEAAGRE